MTTKVTLTYDQWFALFRPFLTEDNAYEDVPDSFPRIFAGSRWLWSEMDDGTIQNGVHLVNRVRYIATREKYPENISIEVVHDETS